MRPCVRFRGDLKPGPRPGATGVMPHSVPGGSGAGRRGARRRRAAAGQAASHPGQSAWSRAMTPGTSTFACVPRRDGWRQWGAVRGESGRELAGQESTTVIGPGVDSEVRRGRDYVRVLIVMTAAAPDVAEALDSAWRVFHGADQGVLQRARARPAEPGRTPGSPAYQQRDRARGGRPRGSRRRARPHGAGRALLHRRVAHGHLPPTSARSRRRST